MVKDCATSMGQEPASPDCPERREVPLRNGAGYSRNEGELYGGANLLLC